MFDFLAVRSDHFDCASLPADQPIAALTGPQATWRYLMWSVALTWIAAGTVSWPALYWLSGVMFAATTAAAYAGTRLFAGPALSCFVGLLVLTSPLQLRHTPLLRDFSKAPFMVAILVLLAVLVTRRLSLKAAALAAAAFGTVLGIGMGFRNDLLIALPPFFIACAIVGLRGQLGNRLRRSAVALSAGFAAFLIAALPLWSAYSAGGGASMAHVALLGFAPEFDEALGVRRSPLYGFGHRYHDDVLATAIMQHASSALGYDAEIRPYDAMYDRASNSMLAAVVTWHPADIWLRGLSAAARVLQSPASGYDEGPLPAIEGFRVAGVLAARERWLAKREAIVAVLVTAAVLLGAIVDPVATVALTLMAAYFAAYPAIQFSPRHYFHLEVLSLIVIAYVPAVAWQSLSSMWLGKRTVSRRDIQSALRNAGIVVAIIVVVLLVPLIVLRWVQDARVARLFESYLDGSRDQVAVEEVMTADGEILLSFPALPAKGRADAQSQAVFGEYVIVELHESCSAPSVNLKLDYDTPVGRQLFDRTITVPRPVAASTMVLFPVYFGRGGAFAPEFRFGFAGLRVDQAQRSCVGAIARVRDASAFPLWLDLVLPAQWRDLPRHQLIAAWERSTPGGWIP